MTPTKLRGVIHRYYLPPAEPRSLGSDSWSLWLLDQDTGSLAIVSDYGNWAHRWGRSGMCETSRGDFRREFLRFGAEYLNNKLGLDAARVFDAEKTRKAVRDRILLYRRSRDVTADVAYGLWREIDIIDDEVGFSTFLDATGHAEIFWECGKSTRHNQQWLDHLTTVTLPRVRAAIQAELDAEAGAA